jgi:hypothetical protein
VDTFASKREGGSRTNKTLCARIKKGHYEIIIVLTKFIGHSLTNNLRKACRDMGADVRFVNGGRTALIRELDLLRLED